MDWDPSCNAWTFLSITSRIHTTLCFKIFENISSLESFFISCFHLMFQTSKFIRWNFSQMWSDAGGDADKVELLESVFLIATLKRRRLRRNMRKRMDIRECGNNSNRDWSGSIRSSCGDCGELKGSGGGGGFRIGGGVLGTGTDGVALVELVVESPGAEGEKEGTCGTLLWRMPR
jgi:hypothetical protein